ncbi:MAG TPA: glycosyltransferase family 39 protein, partial [bacterium]|nr:glycosyltransferase family 39 protein [bacterium]
MGSAFWQEIEKKPLWRLMVWVFLFGLSERLIVTLVLFIRYGWQTVSGIELWFYYGVAQGTFPLYSGWDPTWWALDFLGRFLSGLPLLYSVYLLSSVCSALNSAVFCLFIGELHGRRAGFLAGLVYASAVLPMFNSAGTVTHDVFAYSWLVLTLYGVLLACRRPGIWWKAAGAAIALISMFLGRQVGPTILVGVGAAVLFLFWEACRVFLEGNKPSRYLLPLVAAAGTAAIVSASGRFLFGQFSWKALTVSLAVTLAIFGAWEFMRRGTERGIAWAAPGVCFLAAAVFGWLAGAEEYGLFGSTITGWWAQVLLAVVFGAAAFVLALRHQRRGGGLALIQMAAFLLIVFTVALPLHTSILPQLKEKTFEIALQERGIDVGAQIRAGSGDLLGSSLGDYWLRFNFLLFFLPVGLWVAFRKRDAMSWVLLLSGFLASLAADRGTRPLTFGFVAMGVLAFTHWKVGYQWILAAWMGFIIGQFGGMYSTEYAVFFPAAAVFICLALQWSDKDRNPVGWHVFAGNLAWLTLGGVLGAVAFFAKEDYTQLHSQNALATMEWMKRYWTIQICLIVPVLLLLWEAWGNRSRVRAVREGRG